MSMRIAIVEDKREDREELCVLLEQYCSARGVDAEYTCFPSGDALLAAFEPGTYHCVFLDIYMNGRDGMETARELRRQDDACRLIFYTISLAHAVESYEVRASWYLTKPLSERRLADAMDVVCAAQLYAEHAVHVPIKGVDTKVRMSDILYMDYADRKTRLHLADRTLTVDETAGELMSLLDADERFLICNRSVIVNLDQVERAEEHDFLMKNGDAVPLRLRGRAVLKKVFLEWSLRELRREGQP